MDAGVGRDRAPGGAERVCYVVELGAGHCKLGMYVMYVYTYVRTYVYMYVLYMCVCMYVLYIYIYARARTHTHTHTHTHRVSCCNATAGNSTG